jgi:hypothetical protein
MVASSASTRLPIVVLVAAVVVDAVAMAAAAVVTNPVEAMAAAKVEATVVAEVRVRRLLFMTWELSNV